MWLSLEEEGRSTRHKKLKNRHGEEIFEGRAYLLESQIKMRENAEGKNMGGRVVKNKGLGGEP